MREHFDRWIDDGGTHTAEWLAVSDGTAWWVASLTKTT